MKGRPDSVSLLARYIQGSTTKSSYASMSFVGGDQYNFEWIIPQATAQKALVRFDLDIHKGTSVYGSEKWIDSWAQGNNSMAAFYVNGSVMDDILFNQSN